MIYAENLKGKQDAYNCVFEYIGLFYNSIRWHSAIGYKSQKNYEYLGFNLAFNM